MAGVELVRTLLKREKDVRVVILTGNEEADVIYDAVRGEKGWKALKVQRAQLEVVVPQRKGYTRSPRR